ncbi:MAG: lipoprotein LipL21 [Spirochaetota bacterium]
MKLRYFAILAMVFTMLCNCSSSEPAHKLTGKGVQEFEGWAGPPDDPKGSGPKDYFYMKYAGRASDKARKKRSGAMMQNTCTDAAELSAKGDIIQKLAHESVSGASGVSDGESTGKVVVREFAAKTSGMNRYKCKPIAKADPNIPLSEWNECVCVMFVRIEGGERAIVARAEAIEQGN